MTDATIATMDRKTAWLKVTPSAAPKRGAWLRATLFAACLVALPAVAAAPEAPRTGKRISLQVQRADIQSVLRLLAETGRVNLVMGEDVRGTVTLHLRNVVWDEALDIVLRSNGLGAERSGNILRVAPLKVLKDEAEARVKLAELKKQERPLAVQIIPVNYARAADLAPHVKANLSERGSVSVDERTNSLIVRDVQ